MTQLTIFEDTGYEQLAQAVRGDLRRLLVAACEADGAPHQPGTVLLAPHATGVAVTYQVQRDVPALRTDTEEQAGGVVLTSEVCTLLTRLGYAVGLARTDAGAPVAVVTGRLSSA